MRPIAIFIAFTAAYGATGDSIHFRVQEIRQNRPVHEVSIVDLNDDGKPDLFLGGSWLQNPAWQERPIAATNASAPRPATPQLGWVNAGRRMAVMEERNLVVYEPSVKPFEPQKTTKAHPAVDETARWRRSVVESNSNATAIAWADVDGDGSDELALASPSGIVTYKHGRDGKWAKTKVAAEGSSNLAAADLNADGLCELVATGGNVIRVYWNDTQRSWVRHVIASGFRTQSAIAANFTGRGQMDVIGGDIENERDIYLYSAPDWKRTRLHTGIRLIQSAAFDVDGDGDVDFIGAQYRPGFIFWLERPNDPLHDPWPLHVIDDFVKGGVNGVHGLLTADIDRDGKLDLAANSGWTDGAFPDSLAWFRVPANPRTADKWERHIFADRDAPGLSHYLGVGDVNGDGRLDLASGAKIGPYGNWFAWWEQPADAFKPWTKHALAQNQEGATNILIADLNGDRRPDFIASRGHGKGLVWYEAPNWTSHEIYPELAGPHALAAADIDGDGDTDFVTCAKDAKIAIWFENDGKGNFTIHHVHEDQASYEVRLVDMNGDGKLDILVAGQESQNVVWFENRLAVRSRH